MISAFGVDHGADSIAKGKVSEFIAGSRVAAQNSSKTMRVRARRGAVQGAVKGMIKDTPVVARVETKPGNWARTPTHSVNVGTERNGSFSTKVGGKLTGAGKAAATGAVAVPVAGGGYVVHRRQNQGQ